MMGSRTELGSLGRRHTAAGHRMIARLVVLAGVFAVATHAGQTGDAGQPTTRPTLGAIRWDGWVKESPYQKNLAPKRWHDRLPFYAKVISDTEVEVRADRQEVMDREAAYAKAARLDYWAFLHYHVPWGKTKGSLTNP